jgi:hypothetical protein
MKDLQKSSVVPVQAAAGAATEKSSKKSHEVLSAFSDDEDFDGHQERVRRSGRDGKSNGGEDDDDDNDNEDDDDDEGRAYNDDRDDPNFMVPIKKREFERMFNLKVVESDHAGPEEIAEYVAPNEPLLLVNWTRLSNGVIFSDPTGATSGLGEDQRAAREKILDSILENFETKCEEIFSAKVAYHSDTSVWDKDLQKLNKRFPSECWGPLGYPQ